MSKFAELDEMILRVLDTETPKPFLTHSPVRASGWMTVR